MLNVVLYTIFTTYMYNHYIDTFLYDLDIKDPLYKRNSVYKSIKSNFQEDYSALQEKPFTYNNNFDDYLSYHSIQYQSTSNQYNFKRW